MREALAGLTVRGRAFLAAGVTAIVCAIILGQPALTRVGVLVAALPLVTAAVIGRSRYRLALVTDRQPAAGHGRPAGAGGPLPDERGPHAQWRAPARGPRPLRARDPAAVRARGHRPRVAAARDLSRAVRRARPVRHRPDVRAGQRPLRPGRARPGLPDHCAAHGDPAHGPAPPDPPRGRLDRVGRQPPARVRHRQRGGRDRPRVPPRRRPASRPLAQLRPRRRADGAPRGAAVAVAGHPVPRQPAPGPPRPGHRLLPRGGRVDRRLDRGPPQPCAGSPCDWSRPPARTRAAPGTSATPSSTPARCWRRWRWCRPTHDRGSTPAGSPNPPTGG